MRVLHNHIEENAPRLNHCWTPGEVRGWDKVDPQHRRVPMPPGIPRKLRHLEG